MKISFPLFLILGPLLAAPFARGATGPILVDDDAAELQGEWTQSTKQPPLSGSGYRHDNGHGRGEKLARFTPDLPAPGDYEVRLLYVAHANRSSQVEITVESERGREHLVINQQQPPGALGVFPFVKGRKGSVTVSNAGANGFVVVDGVEFVPADAARTGKASSPGGSAVVSPSYADLRQRQATSVALSPLAKVTAPDLASPRPDREPVGLARDSTPAEVDGKTYDVVVVGGTAGGVACAVRAARDGCTVLLVQHNRHIGGMMANGLMQWDALYGGPRAPLFSELLHNIEQHYVARFGRDSRDHQTARYTHEHYPIGWAEPRVAEREFNRLVTAEKGITLLLSHYPAAVEREGALLRSVTLRQYGTTKDIRVQGSVFADGTYEGDLFALAGVPFRVGREARDEYQEPHAGKVFVNIDHAQAPGDAIEGRLNLRPYGSRQGSVDPASPFTADGAVQAYNYRFCVTNDPANRVMISSPPPGYNREEYVNYDRKSIATNGGPNRKSHMNSPILPGENHAYPEASWPEREKIIERHLNFALGLVWFLQNDESVPAAARERFRAWGLPKDEFPDHGHIPYEMYVREARRIVGRHVLTQNDGMLARDHARTPVQPDSIGITDWYMDSHSCTLENSPGHRYDGKLILTEESRPAQIPYRSLLPQGVDNLLVPVCLSATHVAWGAVRLEPVWMQTGEAAGVAAALAVKGKVPPAKLNADLLVRALCQDHFLVSFFNDIKVNGEEPWIAAAQYLGTRGFFHDYNVRADEPLKSSTAKVWTDGLVQQREGRLDGNLLAAAVARAEAAESPPITTGEFTALLPQSPVKVGEDSQVLTRGQALERLWAALKQE